MKKLVLVLGGGAAKGFAHIGALKVLEKHGIKPDLIVGTSMGAMVGGMYAAGNDINTLNDMAIKFNKIGSFSLISTIFNGNVMNISKVKKILRKTLGEKTFNQTEIPLITVSTELNTGKVHLFKEGKLRDGIMASIAIPGIFPSLKIGKNTYCDGGMLNNLAEDVGRAEMPDAVVVSIDVIGDYASQIEKCKLKVMETFINATTLMTTNVIKNRPVYADYRISMSMPTISQMDFSKQNSLKAIKKGENFMRKHISNIKKLLAEEIINEDPKSNYKSCKKN